MYSYKGCDMLMNTQNGRQPSRQRQNASQPKGGSVSTETLFCFAIAAILILINFRIFSGIITENPDKIQTIPVDADTEARIIAEDQAKNALEKDIQNNFIEIDVNADDTKVGDLVLVNNTHPFSFDSVPSKVKKEELVVFYGKQSDDYVVSYPSREKITEEAIKAFNDLTADFAAEKGIRNLLVLDSYRSYEDQQRVYETKGPEIATIPGCSEHHTGLAFDLEIHGVGDFDGTGDYAWVAENCYKYGYILRYAEDKTALTGISYEPWHFRYVGKEHAYFMHTNNLCLEEYVELLSKYPINSARLNFTTDSGEKYMIYSAAVTGESGKIHVPNSLEYTLSGDNNGHVIISCKIP